MAEDGMEVELAPEMEGPGRKALKELQNVKLNVSRALKEWAPGSKAEQDLASAKDEFSKAKFIYLELATKNEFVREILEGKSAEDRNLSEMEEQLAEGKAGLKKAKGRCQAAKEEIDGLIKHTLQQQELLDAETANLKEYLENQDQSAGEDAVEVTELEQKITEKQEVLQQQEDEMKRISNERQELETAIRTLEAEVATASAQSVTPTDLHARRMAAWYQSANKVMSALNGVSAVRISDFEAEVDFAVKPFGSSGHAGMASQPSNYTLLLKFQEDSTSLAGASLTPPDVHVADLQAAITLPGGSVAGMFAEVKNRLACRLAMLRELEPLRSKLTINVSQEGGAYLVSASPSYDSGTSRWHCEVSVDCDYPRAHCRPDLISVRHGAFTSPGAKRERALLDSLARRAHPTLAALLDDVASRFAG